MLLSQTYHTKNYMVFEMSRERNVQDHFLNSVNPSSQHESPLLDQIFVRKLIINDLFLLTTKQNIYLCCVYVSSAILMFSIPESIAIGSGLSIDDNPVRIRKFIMSSYFSRLSDHSNELTSFVPTLIRFIGPSVPIESDAFHDFYLNHLHLLFHQRRRSAPDKADFDIQPSTTHLFVAQ